MIFDGNKEHFELNVSGMDHTGPIPDTTTGKLSKLQSMDLSYNWITALPSNFWSLSSVMTLNNIGNSGLVEIFDLSSNNYAEEIPEAINSLLSVHVLKLPSWSFSDYSHFQLDHFKLDVSMESKLFKK